MWLSRQIKPGAATADADLGITTISGQKVGVVTRGEVRSLPVYGPGGYAWLPGNGAEVLVIKGGPGGEEQCVAGAKQTPPAGLLPGEVCVYGPGDTQVRLRRDGTLELRGGTVSIHGQLLINGEPYRPCYCG